MKKNKSYKNKPEEKNEKNNNFLLNKKLKKNKKNRKENNLFEEMEIDNFKTEPKDLKFFEYLKCINLESFLENINKIYFKFIVIKSLNNISFIICLIDRDIICYNLNDQKITNEIKNVQDKPDLGNNLCHSFDKKIIEI